jgi:hypothetical protein
MKLDALADHHSCGLGEQRAFVVGREEHMEGRGAGLAHLRQHGVEQRAAGVEVAAKDAWPGIGVKGRADSHFG